MSSGFNVMKWTRKLLTDTHTQRKDENYILHCILHMPRNNQRYGSCVLHVVSWFKICMKFHENMSSGFNPFSARRHFSRRRLRANNVCLYLFYSKTLRVCRNVICLSAQILWVDRKVTKHVQDHCQKHDIMKR